MEVDRIWRIDGLDGNAQPAWQKSAQRRRKFTEDVEPPAEETPDSEAKEESSQDESAAELRRDYSESSAPDAPNSPDDPDPASFRAIA